MSQPLVPVLGGGGFWQAVLPAFVRVRVDRVAIVLRTESNDVV